MRKIEKNIGLGERIKTIRLQLGKTQTEFGKMFDPPAPKGAVSRWEHGGGPNKKRLKEIADLGNVTVDYLLGLTKYKNVDNGDFGLSDKEKLELKNTDIAAFEYFASKQHIDTKSLSEEDKLNIWNYLQNYQFFVNSAMNYGKVTNIKAVDNLISSLLNVMVGERLGKAKISSKEVIQSINDLTKKINSGHLLD